MSGSLFIGRSNDYQEIERILTESSDEELEAKLGRFKMTIVALAQSLGGIDCQTWALNKMGLPQYGFERAGSIQRALIMNQLPEVERLSPSSPVDGALVAYCFPGIEELLEEPPKPYCHYGILCLNNGEWFVTSKWGAEESETPWMGRTHVFRHPLIGINYFGNYVDLYKKRGHSVTIEPNNISRLTLRRLIPAEARAVPKVEF